MRVEQVISEEQIKRRVAEMAGEIKAVYQGKRPLLVTVLKGSFVFLADLCRELGAGFPLDFMAISSYTGKEATGAVEIRLDLSTNIEGRDVLIIEDIVDSGLTLEYLAGLLRARGAGSLRVATLLLKPDAYKGSERIDFIGFRIPDEFVVGYGMDLDEEWRNLRFVGRVES